MKKKKKKDRARYEYFKNYFFDDYLEVLVKPIYNQQPSSTYQGLSLQHANQPPKINNRQQTINLYILVSIYILKGRPYNIRCTAVLSRSIKITRRLQVSWLTLAFYLEGWVFYQRYDAFKNVQYMKHQVNTVELRNVNIK